MDAQPVLLVYLRTAGGITGVGEGVVPSGPWRGGESVETMQLIIERYMAPILLGREVDDIVGIGRDIDDVVAANLFVLLLGREADRIRAIVATKQGINQEADYDEAIEDHRAMDQVAEHATNALSAAGLDGEWWAYQVGCTRGYELVALAASDLVDKGPERDEQSSQPLMRPWSEAMGGPHAA